MRVSERNRSECSKTELHYFRECFVFSFLLFIFYFYLSDLWRYLAVAWRCLIGKGLTCYDMLGAAVCLQFSLLDHQRYLQITGGSKLREFVDPFIRPYVT